MSVTTFNPKSPNNHSHDFDPATDQTQEGCGGGSCGCGGHHQMPVDDGIRVMPTSDDLKRLSSDAKLIEEALAEEKSDHRHLIASSRQTVPSIRVNGVVISEQAIGEEVQYHPASSQEEALFLSAQALVIKELLKQAVLEDKDLGQKAWDTDEEQAISDLLAKHVQPNQPSQETCQQYYQANSSQFVSPPVMKVRHILLACPPEEGEERLELKKQATDLIEKLQKSDNLDADFISFAMQHSACPSKTDGGDLGVLQKGATVPEFEKAVFALSKGLCVNPIETRYGIHIVDVLEKVDGKPLTFDNAKAMIENTLTQQSFHHALVDYLFLLKQNAHIEGIDINVNQENIYRG